MDIVSKFKEFALKTGFCAKFSFNEPIASKTTFKIGGNALVFVEPEDVLQILDLLFRFLFWAGEAISFLQIQLITGL